MKSDYLTQGPITPEFEKAISKYTNSKYSVAVINATSALHIACVALELKQRYSMDFANIICCVS